MSKKVLHTKFGKVKINHDGYYQITSKKEGNNKKMLHRLIFEDFYGMKIPKGFIIHHKNENKLDNCILNLQLMRFSDHISHHKSGKKHPLYGKSPSEETRRKLSEAVKGEKHPLWGKGHTKESKIKMNKTKNTSGYYRVTKMKNKRCSQGFTWRYSYFENGKVKEITSVDLDKLKKKVISKGLDWIKFDDDTEQ